jgi:hypothetical protein
MRNRDGHQWEHPDTRRKNDYVDRTDGQPVYRGHARFSASEDDPHWVITYSEYDESGNLTDSWTTVGSWTGRVVLFA